MLQTLKKIQAEKINKNNYQFVETIVKAKNKKAEQWRGLIASYKGTLQQNLHMLQKVEGISLWIINYQLNKLAVKGLSKEQLKNSKIVLSLPAKQTGEITSEYQKMFIEKTIDGLEGFENLRLSHFYSYKPVYVEKKVFSGVARWIEIEVSEL